MSMPDHGDENGLLNLAELSLNDLPGLDDSVVANAIRLLYERRRCGMEYMETFDQFNSGP
jgi:hypothetical protein